jgi:PAS domain S-box-containing protein
MGEPKPPAAAGEEHVKIESEHLAAIIRSSDDAILSKDRNAIITSWNEAAERLYGWPAEEAVGKSVAIIIPPERQGEELEIVDRIIAGERLEHYETERMRRDGTRVRVSLVASPIHGSDGEIVGVSTQARDLSSTHLALQQAEQRFLSAFKDSPVGMSVFSAEPGSFGQVQQANAEMTRLLGYTEDEMRNISPGEITHPDDAAVERVLIEELQAGQRSSYGIEKRNRHKDGRWVWVWVTVSLLDAGESPPRLALAHMLDITERKRAESDLMVARQNLERSNSELDQFAYVASHDLKEPLILLSAYARMLDERHGDALDEEGRTFLSHVREEATRMKGMIDDLLDYSRLETQAEENVTVDLREALESALRTLAPAIDEAGARVELDGRFPVIQGSLSQFERLFRNLISNALKFHGDEPPAVQVRSGMQADAWIIEVRDNGIGIDPAKADRIFDVFQRLHGQEQYAGTGMGLAICKRIVERHGGRIWVEPHEPGGSVFSIALPEQ